MVGMLRAVPAALRARQAAFTLRAGIIISRVNARQPISSLKEFLEATRLEGRLNSDDFNRIVLGGDAPLIERSGPSRQDREATPGAHLWAAVHVLDRALVLNPDEAIVLRWFRQERLADFGLKTPLEIAASGRGDALLAYVDSLEAGSSG